MLTNNVKRANKTNALPDVPVHGVGTVAKYVIDEPRGNFILLHYPSNWDLSKDGEWLPGLSEVDIKPGINRVGGIVGNENLSQSREWFIKKGATEINPTDKRLGKFINPICVKNGLYKKDALGSPVHKHYYLGHKICTLTTRQKNDGTIHVVPVTDQKIYDEFRRHLVQSGIVEPVSEEVLIRHLERLISARDSLSIYDKLSETTQKHLDNIKKKIAIIQEQLAQLEGSEDIEPNEDADVDYSNSPSLDDEVAEPLDFAPLTPPTKKGRK